MAEPRSSTSCNAAESFRAQGVSVLGVVGGDGTSNRAVTACRAAYGDDALLTLSMLRGGTMNTVANACGVPRGRPGGVVAAAPRARRRAGLHRAQHPAHRRPRGLPLRHRRGGGPRLLRRGEPSPAVAARVLARALGSTLVGGPSRAR
ncbi:MAG: diacylglycerol kinase family protein [Polyangiales bacterium]